MPLNTEQITTPLATSDYTLHIALTNLPQKNGIQYIKHIKEKLFEDYKKQCNEYLQDGDKLDDTLFKPLQYYIFGNYDIAFITLVDRFKFSQKLFVPKKDHDAVKETKESKFDPSAFQVITGICPEINKDFEPQTFFRNKEEAQTPDKDRFVTICNLKLNNKLLIGNGTNFYDLVVITINELIKKHFALDDEGIKDKYFVMQSFSWFEISVVLFTEKIDCIKDIIGRLRILTLKDLREYCINKVKDCISVEQIFENSIYKKDNNATERYMNFNDENIFLFADSHSYIGVHKDLIENENINYKERIKSQIEAQLKPGYLKGFKENISKVKKIKKKSNIYNENKPHYLITGKYDYQFQLAQNNIENNLALIRAIMSNTSFQTEFSKYTRKIKTTIIFDYKQQISGNPEQIIFNDIIKEKFIDPITIDTLNNILKKLKISRLIRGKVVKIFYNYTNTIQDSILFIFLLDFVDFINFLRNWILKQGEIFSKNLGTGYSKREPMPLVSVNLIEDHLIRFIDIFQKGYMLRLLNSYQFEDINDFDLDYNSSPQQVLSAYNSIAKEIQGLFFASAVAKDFPDSPVIQINLKSTVADAFSINYDVFHLLSPEFVLFTIVKEILNKYYLLKGDTDYYKIDEKCKGLYERLSQHKYFHSLSESGLSLLDINNIFIDYIRLGILFNFDYRMFYTWSWMYSFQNASMYDEIGLFNETHFKKELIRILFIGFLSNNIESINAMECPLPELQVYWNRHYLTHKKNLGKMFNPEFGTQPGNIYMIINELRGYMNNLLGKILLKFFSKTSTGVNLISIENSSFDIDESTTDIVTVFHGFKNVYDKEYVTIIDKLKTGTPVLCNTQGEHIYTYFFQISYTYLKYIYEGNNREVHLLRRNWNDGKPLKSFIKYQKNDWLYNVDQMGGLFFTNNENAKIYFRVRNAVMQSLWHLGMVLKKKHFFK